MASYLAHVSDALHAAGLMRQRAAPRQRTVVIWQAAGGVGHRLEFMYKPVIDTLTDGFTDVPARVLEAVGKPRVVHGYGVRSLSTFAAGLRRESLGSTGHGRDATRALPLGNGDTFVWIGPVGSGTPPWVELRRLGVRTVYFQTEPADGCQFAQSNAQEIWEFSWHNFDACARQLPDGITLRYVPLGFHAPPARELSTTKAALPPRGRHNELLFFGYPFYKSGRGLCYAQLARALGARLNATWMVWTLEDFEAWWATHGQWAAHLNLHKTCESQHNPVVFRTALLLSRGATVLSERAYWRDEQEYAGLVRFGRVQELATMLDAALDSPPGINRGSSAGSVVTTTAMHALQTHAHVAKLYAERFAPQRIFERALVYDTHLLNLSLGKALERRKASSSGLQQQGEGGHSAVAVGTRGPPSLSRARFALGGRARGGRGGSGKGVRDQGNGVHTRNGGGRRGARASSTGKHAFESQAAPTMAPFALLLHGRVGTLMAAPSISIVMSSLRPADYAIPIAACAASHLEHVVRANRAATQGASAGVDIFAHTWNPSVASFFNFEYGSHLRASLHEPLEFKDKEKPRSQALSIGRAAGLMAKHEAMRNRPYAFCLVLRSDLLVGAPILLRDFDRTRVWFAEHCCMNEATSALEKAAVHAKCDSPKFSSGWQQNDPRYRAKLTGQFNYRKRILGPCRVTQYGGYWGLQNYKEDYYYAVRGRSMAPTSLEACPVRPMRSQ